MHIYIYLHCSIGSVSSASVKSIIIYHYQLYPNSPHREMSLIATKTLIKHNIQKMCCHCWYDKISVMCIIATHHSWFPPPPPNVTVPVMQYSTVHRLPIARSGLCNSNNNNSTLSPVYFTLLPQGNLTKQQEQYFSLRNVKCNTIICAWASV